MTSLIMPVRAQARILSFLEPKEVVHTSWSGFFSTPLAYALYECEETTAEQITAWVATGRKIGLFIGRRPYEALPEEPGILWISMDPNLGGGSPGIQFFDENRRPERYHLQMPFCPETAGLLKNLFEKVVVDQATFKNFADYADDVVIENLIQILNPQGQALLVFDNSPPGTTVDDAFNASAVTLLKKHIPHARICDEGEEEGLASSSEPWFSMNQVRKFYKSSGEYSWIGWNEKIKTAAFLRRYFKQVRCEHHFARTYPLRHLGNPQIIHRHLNRPFFSARGLR